MKSTLLAFEAHGMLTHSHRHRVEIRLITAEEKHSEIDANITCLESKRSDGWYELLDAVPAEVAHSNDAQRIEEFLQDILLSMGDALRKSVIGIREDPHGLLDFLLPANG